MKDQKKGKPKNSQKKLLGLYKLPSKSDWNEGMTEDEKRSFIDSMIKDLAGKQEAPKEEVVEKPKTTRKRKATTTRKPKSTTTKKTTTTTRKRRTTKTKPEA